MRAKKTTDIKPRMLLEIVTQGTMGVALGLTFAFLAIRIPATGVDQFMAVSSDDVRLEFEGISALMFGIGAALTALVFRMTEDE